MIRFWGCSTLFLRETPWHGCFAQIALFDILCEIIMRIKTIQKIKATMYVQETMHLSPV